jgi:hypothetical protein
MNPSVPSGRWGPCCSTDPTGSTIGVPASISAWTSGEVMRISCRWVASAAMAAPL